MGVVLGMLLGVSVFGAPALTERQRAAMVEELKSQRNTQADHAAELTGKLQVAEEDLLEAQQLLDKCTNNRR